MQERTAHQAVVMDKVDRDAEATAERGEEVVATEAEEGEEERRDWGERGGGSAVIEVPAPDGDLQPFRVQQTQRMESELASAHPEIATWS